MRTRSWTAIVLLMVGCTAAVLLAAAPANRNARWEYKFLLAQRTNPVAKSLESDPSPDELGDDGWELVTVTPNGSDHLWLFFKRPK